MAEGLVIPISTPGGEESAAVLDRIADKLEEVGGAAGASATKMGTSATASSAAIGRIADATEKTKTAVERLEESGNRGLHALSEKASELAGSMGGAAGKIADVGLKSLAAFGGIGLQATAAVGAVLMLYNAYQQYEEKQRAVSAGAAALASVNAQLGGSYDAVRLAAAQDGTAEERTNAIRAAGILIRQQRIALQQQGFSGTASAEFVGSLDRLMAAYAALGTAAPLATREMVQHAIQSGNAAEQQDILELSFEHSTDATVEHANQTRALTIVSARAAASSLAHRQELQRAADAAVASARATVAALNDQADSGAAGDRAISALNAALATQALRNAQVASATASNTLAQQGATVATQELAAAAAAANEEGKRHAQQQVSDAVKERQRAAARAASSPQELRAQAEALRLAREANDNAGRTITFEQQMESLRLRLAFATREVAFAQASHHDHTRRLTTALQAQTEVINAQRAAADAQADSYRPLREVILALTSAEAQRLQVSLDADKVETSKIRNGEVLLRQEGLAAMTRRRAREDAVAANAAAMGGGETAAERAGISTGESARAVLATAEADATRELARATRDLAAARLEESDASISTEERTTHVTEALARQTTALQRQRAAQAASNAEVQKIRTDRMDFLTNSTKGLADGLVQAGLAAAFAGESVGAALQKQLAASLQALAVEAAQKALFATATGLFQLATGNPAAASSFASAATFAAVAVTAGAIGAAVAPAAAPTTPGAAPGAGRAGDVTPSGAGGMGGGAGAGPIVNNYYAPIVGGRQSTDAETGVRIDRYNDAARARLRRAA
jgi:chromosome segregation protein